MMETSQKSISEILKHINSVSSGNSEQYFTRLFRYLLRPEIYHLAYEALYANKGALTKGSNDDTADGFGEEYVMELIEDLRNEKYQTSPVRRTYIKKKNGKLRPLGIPSFRDKLLQEAVKMILEAIYEPLFDDNSHGFRPKRSCHTALDEVKRKFQGVPWIIEGDIHACFDCIDHKVLMGLLGNKIKDQRFLNIIGKFLKSGYIDNWIYHDTYSGCPQGGICSPILANIYLNELDRKIREIGTRFEEKNITNENGKIITRYITKEYTALSNKSRKLSRLIGETPNGQDRDLLIRELRSVKKEMRSTKCSINIMKKIVYVRYADDWLVGVYGSKQDCERIKEEIREFLDKELKLELSIEKTLITHSSNRIRFLGYDISIRRNANRVITYVDKSGRRFKKRTLNGSVNLEVPLKDKIESYLLNKGAVIRLPDGRLVPVARNKLIGKPDHEIVKTYNSEVRGILNFYTMADNRNKLNYFCFLMEYSCLKTLAAKHKKTCRKIKKLYRCNEHWSVPYKTKSGEKRAECIRYYHYEFKKYIPKETVDTIDEYNYYPRKTGLSTRLKAGICECCGVKMAQKGVVHVVRKLKDLGHKPWELIMKRMRRKTLIVCKACHTMIHAPA